MGRILRCRWQLGRTPVSGVNSTPTSDRKRITASIRLKTNHGVLWDEVRTLQKGVWGRRFYRSGGQNPLGVLQVK